MPLTPDEERWCAWMESLPGLQRAGHEELQTCSLQAFAAGVESERERVRSALQALVDASPAGPPHLYAGTVERVCDGLAEEEED